MRQTLCSIMRSGIVLVFSLGMRLLKQLDSSPRLEKKNLTNTSQFSRRCDLSTIGLIPDPLLSPSCHQVQVHSDVFSPIASYPGFSSQDFISKSEDVMAPLTHLPTHNSCKGLVTSSTWCMCLPCCLGRKKSALANSAWSSTRSRLKPHPAFNELAIVTALSQQSLAQTGIKASSLEMVPCRVRGLFSQSVRA